jgi:hypothetical protein
LTLPVNDVSPGVNAARALRLYFSTGPGNQCSDFEARRETMSYVNATLQAGAAVTASVIGTCLFFASGSLSRATKPDLDN